ncbi:MAG: ABC transporter substrate-binding protein [Acetobacteraceae bacterium]
MKRTNGDSSRGNEGAGKVAGLRLGRRRLLAGGAAVAIFAPAVQSRAAGVLNAYSIWPDPYARPVFAAFEKESGIHVNFLRFSSGVALARVIAEKSDPQVDVLFGGPIATFTAGELQGVFALYRPPADAVLAPQFKDPKGYWTAIANDPLCFMFNADFLKKHNLQPPVSWNDLLNPAFKNMLQMADARTSGTAVTRIFSILTVNKDDEKAAFDYMKKLRKQVQVYTKSGGGGTLPIGLGEAAGGIFFLVDALYTRQRGYKVAISFPKEGIGAAPEGIALIAGAKHLEAGKKLIDWATSPAMQSLYEKEKINFIPANPKVKEAPDIAELLKSAHFVAINRDWEGANRKRIVDLWVKDVLNS